MPRRRLGGFLLFLLLSGCALLNRHDQSDFPLAMPIAPPTAPGRRVVQQISAYWPGSRQEVLLCVLELDQRHIAMAGLTNDGLDLFNVSYDGKSLLLDKSPLVPDSVAPELMLADMQLVYWPLELLQKTLSAPWRLDAGRDYRRLFYNNQPVQDVNYLAPDPLWPRSVELVNHRHHYRLLIKTVSYEALPE